MESVEVDLVRMPGQQVPAGSAEVAAQVAGEFFAFVPVANIKELPERPVGILTGFSEPLMLVRTVVHHQVHHDGNPVSASLRNQFLHICHSAETRIYIIIVGNIIALVCQRRAVTGGKPYDFNPEFLKVVQLFDDAPQIPDSVAVCVIKAFRVNLIRCFSVPPFSFHRLILPLDVHLCTTPFIIDPSVSFILQEPLLSFNPIFRFHSSDRNGFLLFRQKQQLF